MAFSVVGEVVSGIRWEVIDSRSHIEASRTTIRIRQLSLFEARFEGLALVKSIFKKTRGKIFLFPHTKDRTNKAVD